MATKLKIWGRPNSTNVKKALWAATELGLPFESIAVGKGYAPTNTPEYLALNPNALVPTLQDGDLTVWESNAIVRYLAAQYSTADKSLWLADARQRAIEDQWMDWCSTTIPQHFSRIIYGVLRSPPDQQNWDQINEAVKVMGQALAIPDATLAKQPYLGGNEFGIADIPLGCFAYAWFEMPNITRPDLPNLRAWYERLKQRPAYQKEVMIKLT